MKYILAQDKSNYSLWQIETLLKNLLGLGVSITDIYVLLGSYGYNKRYKALYRAFRGVNFVEYRNLTDLNLVQQSSLIYFGNSLRIISI